MSRYLLDTNAASDYINRRHDVFERARAEVMKGNVVGICIPVLAELLAGIERSQSRDRNMKSLKGALAALRVWPFDAAAGFEYGRLFAELSRIGRPIGIVDLMIASVALSLGSCIVVSTDSDLRAVTRLGVENWRSAS